MQVVVSMYLATVGTLRIPESPPTRGAEERGISRFCALMIASSSLLDLHEEGLVFRGPRVRVEDRRREEVGERPRPDPRETPVNRHADLPHVLAVHTQGPKALGDQGLALNRAARVGDLEHLLVGDALLLRHLLRNLEEEALLDLVQPPVVLGPVVEVLGEPVRRADDRVLLPLGPRVLVR